MSQRLITCGEKSQVLEAVYYKQYKPLGVGGIYYVLSIKLGALL